MAFPISFPYVFMFFSMSCVFLGVFLSYATSNFNFCDVFFSHSSSVLVFFQLLICYVLHELMFLCFGFCFIEVIASFLMHGEIFGKNSICSVAKIFWHRLFPCHLFHRYLLSCAITQTSYTNSHSETQLWIRYFLAWIFAQCHWGREKIVFQGNKDFPHNPGLYA